MSKQLYVMDFAPGELTREGDECIQIDMDFPDLKLSWSPVVDDGECIDAYRIVRRPVPRHEIAPLQERDGKSDGQVLYELWSSPDNPDRGKWHEVLPQYITQWHENAAAFRAHVLAGRNEDLDKIKGMYRDKIDLLEESNERLEEHQQVLHAKIAELESENSKLDDLVSSWALTAGDLRKELAEAKKSPWVETSHRHPTEKDNADNDGFVVVTDGDGKFHACCIKGERKVEWKYWLDIRPPQDAKDPKEEAWERHCAGHGGTLRDKELFEAGWTAAQQGGKP